MTEANELQAQATPTEAKSAPKRNLFEKMIELFQRKKEAVKPEPGEQSARRSLLNFLNQENQAPKARFFAGGPAQLDLSIIPPGTVVRIESIRPGDLEAIKEGDDESPTDAYKSFFWFVKGTGNEIYKVQPVIKGKRLYTPSSTAVLSRTTPYALAEITPTRNFFKPEDTFRVLYPEDREDHNPDLHPNPPKYETEFLHRAYTVIEVDIMESGSYGISNDFSTANVVDVVAIQPSASPKRVLSPA